MHSTIKTLLLELAVLFVLAAAGWGLVNYRHQDPRPCTRPILYSIGAVDPRFNVTTEALVTNAEAATSIWNQAAGRKILGYDPTAKLKINLLYDAREANATFGVAISGKQAEQDSARAALEALQARFTAAQGAYNQEVNAINARGSATPGEAQALQAEQGSLSVLADSIKSEAGVYNARGSALNAQVELFNQQAGQILKAGQYVRDSTGQRIDVFKFIGDTELVRFLAHEFGHALGLDHNGDPNSIMYEKNESGNLTPSAADLSSLRAVCRL
jgi:hypothetical protein